MERPAKNVPDVGGIAVGWDQSKHLLDWTDSALVALYFAISSVRQSNETTASLRPVVWALNPWRLDARYLQPLNSGPDSIDEAFVDRYLPPVFAGRRLPAGPIALDPTFIAQRVLVQHSHFTIHGNARNY